MRQDISEILDDLLSLSEENEYVEFKEAKTGFDREKIGEYFSALSNEACLHNQKYGYLVFGVENKSHEIVGTTYGESAKVINDIKKFVGEQVNTNTTFVDIYTVEREGKRVVIFKIPAANGYPVSFKRVFYGRDGESIVKLSLDKIDMIRRMYVDDWSAEIVPDATLEDLDPDAIEYARKLYTERHRNIADEIKGWDTMTFLNKAKLTLKGKITNTALLLVGRNESEYMLLPADPKIRWILKNECGDILSHHISGIPLVFAVNEISSKIRNLKYMYMKKDSLFPEEVDQYDPFIIREALNNCIAHQDYRVCRRIDVIERDDFLEFVNGGTFLPGDVETVVIENSPEGFYRNRFLVEAMTNLQMIETMGSGIRKIFEIQNRKCFPLPDYDFSKNRVSVRIVGKVVDMDLAKILVQNRDLSWPEIFALDKVSKKKPINDYEIKALRKKHLIEGRKPNFYLSREVAESLGRKAEYINNKGMDNSYYRDLIIQAIEQYKKMSRAEIDELLWNKLPDNLNDDQKKTKIENLIKSLRLNGQIVNIASRRTPIWTLQ